MRASGKNTCGWRRTRACQSGMGSRIPREALGLPPGAEGEITCRTIGRQRPLLALSAQKQSRNPSIEQRLLKVFQDSVHERARMAIKALLQGMSEPWRRPGRCLRPTEQTGQKSRGQSKGVA